MSAPSNLFQPIRVGNFALKHRVVLAPLTRWRTDGNHTPLPIVSEYYSQRASVPGTLLITEATFIAPKAGGFPYAPGIWSEDQITAWKRITEEVHAKGCVIFLQLWALGRAARPEELEKGSFPYVSASDVQLPSKAIPPRPLTMDEIAEYAELFATAASNAVHKAGFDGVEIHGANTYLIDQFIHDVVNKRTDAYGGSPEKRARFPLEIVAAVCKAIGSQKTGIRLSPWNTSPGTAEANPIASFTAVVTQLRDSHSNLAYIHVVEPDRNNFTGVEPDNRSNDFLREIWGSRPFIAARGYDREKAINDAQKFPNSLVAFGRYFISNPDLPRRLENDIPLHPYDPTTFYLQGSTSHLGYTDQPFAVDPASK